MYLPASLRGIACASPPCRGSMLFIGPGQDLDLLKPMRGGRVCCF
jgi:hypothetical protein